MKDSNMDGLLIIIKLLNNPFIKWFYMILWKNSYKIWTKNVPF
jgi:hypothetical protein